MTRIAILDYGMGNFHSVARALQHAAPHSEVRLCRDADELAASERIVLPGQGAMADCMRVLTESGLREALMAAIANKPLLGICVGEQMLFTASEEKAGDTNDTPCLDVFAGQVRRFAGPAFTDNADTPRLKIPHIGWNRVYQRSTHPLWTGIPDGAHFYFVHSYYADPADPALIAAHSHYGLPFACAVAADNIFAVQFHPEKSAAHGLQLLRNFVDWRP